MHVKHAKEEMVKQIKQLQTSKQLADRILSAISSGEQVSEIIQRLKNGDPYNIIVDWLGCNQLEDSESLSSVCSAQMQSEHDTVRARVPFNKSFWTKVAPNEAVVDRLLRLYFTWVHPVHVLFDEVNFRRSFQNNSTEFCSSALVNAICSLACHLHSGSLGDPDNECDSQALGDRFLEKVQSLIRCSEHRLLTTAQTLGILFMIEVGRGQGLRAASYLRMANSILHALPLARASASEREIWKTTFWGIYTLSMYVALTTFSTRFFFFFFFPLS
jgi:hypothetical protein